MITTANIGLHGIQQNLSNGTEELLKRLFDSEWEIVLVLEYLTFLPFYIYTCIGHIQSVLAQPVKKEKGKNQSKRRVTAAL